MPLRLKLLVVFHAVLAVLASVVAWQMPPNIEYLPYTWVAAGLVLGQIGLLSFWLGMGQGHFQWRCQKTLLAAAYLCAVIVFWPPMGKGNDQSIFDFSKSFLATFALVQLMIWPFAGVFFAIRKWVSQLVCLSHPSLLPQPRMRFTIFQLLLLTTVVAMLFGLRSGASNVNDSTGSAHVVLLNLLLFCVLLIDLLFGLWSSLGSGRTWLRITLVIITAACLGLIVNPSAGDLQMAWRYQLSATLITLVPTIVVVASLLVVRSCGYRLVPKGPGIDVDDSGSQPAISAYESKVNQTPTSTDWRRRDHGSRGPS